MNIRDDDGTLRTALDALLDDDSTPDEFAAAATAVVQPIIDGAQAHFSAFCEEHMLPLSREMDRLGFSGADKTRLCMLAFRDAAQPWFGAVTAFEFAAAYQEEMWSQ